VKMALSITLICLVLTALLLPGLPTSAAAPTLNPANGHYYELLPGPMNWTDLQAAANSRSYSGMQGHLVTITSQSEQDFILSTFPTAFTLGYRLGAIKGASGWEWVTGETFSYTYWMSGEPNNLGGNENNIELKQGKWNDIAFTNSMPGSIVEYEINSQPSQYSVTFTQSGLPSGHNWSVTMNDVKSGSTFSTITFDEMNNGTYSYVVDPIDGYQASPSNGTVEVNGSDQNITISWNNEYITVQGQVNFKWGTNYFAAKNCKVMLYDQNFPFLDELIAEGYTSEDGSFNFSIDKNGNPISWHESVNNPREIYVKILAENEATRVTNDWGVIYWKTAI
jgi:hypothetical protein